MQEPKVIHHEEDGRLAPEFMNDHDLLVYIATMLARLEPLIEALEGAGPALASMMPDADGNKPSPFKMAMGAAKLARGR